MVFTRFFEKIKKFDWVILGVTILLIAFGLTAIYSIDAAAENPDFLKFKKQIFFAVFGLIVLVVLGFFDYRRLAGFSLVFYILGVILLVAVLIFGQEIRGTKGWLVIFGQTILQPVELVKLFFIIFISKYLTDNFQEFYRLKHLLVSGGITAGVVALVLLQPDFGSAFIFIILWLAMLFFVNTKRSYLVVIFIFLVSAILISWFFVLAPYQKARIVTFLNPSFDPLGQGYSVSQSIIAIGSGKIWGRGLGLGPQSQLHFLPEAETDFIFAVIAEELGLLGSLGVVMLMVVLFTRIFKIIKNSLDNFSLFLALNIFLMLFIQIVISIGMNLGLAPITGIPLPFLSAGGSSLLSALMGVGILESIVVHSPKASV